MVWESPKDAMPWVGLYVGVASLICTLAMAIDAIHAIWQWKLWFPNNFFTINASTITLIAIAMKIPMDLSTDSPLHDPHRLCNMNIIRVKMVGINFLVTMLANFLPSLGLMDDRELIMNIVALGILMLTIAVNLGIQTFTQVIYMYFDTLFMCIFAFLWPFSIALTVSASRKKLEHRYKESQLLVSSYQEKKFSSKGLRSYVKKYWMMTETRNPQFVIACSPVSSAFGVICLFNFLYPVRRYVSGMEYFFCDASDYKWSLKIIYIVQSVGTIVASIAPISRCMSSVGHYNLSKEWSKNHLNVFRVEKHWIQRLQKWKRRHVQLHIPSRHCKIVFHNVKNTCLNLCITLHILVLVICKTICLVPRIILILLSYCWYFFKSCLKWFQRVTRKPNGNEIDGSELKEYVMYVIQIEEDAKLSDRILRNTLRYITQLLQVSEEKEPRYLMVLLEKSIRFNGVAEFESEQVQPLYPKETHNCWSLVVVTLTSVAIALPNIVQGHVNSLLSGVREGLQIVRHIEECLNGDNDTLETRKAAKRVWAEVEVYHSWLQINLHKMARKGKTSKEILQWLGDEAEKIMREFKSSKKPSIDQSPYKFIVASSMHRISRSMLLNINEQDLLNDEEIFEWISTMTADILSACFTNLPRVIKLKCHHHAIEKRGESIRNAAELLGKCKKILKILKARKLPNMDLDSMAYIDKWRVVLKGQILNDHQLRYGNASITGIEPTSSSCSERVIVSVM
ncbi:hypothetical protein SSX86_012502 [Deinandra increscens subsp. villosa]|uniref:Uncharacterized protein n=1 Tax=Deinandra increscens subsp. villosa TaxID=3103831 RepID=A0AAP0D4U0_9ASTR